MTKTNVTTRHDSTTDLSETQYRLFTLVKTQRWLRAEGHIETANKLQGGIETYCDELDWDLSVMMAVTVALRAEGIIS